MAASVAASVAGSVVGSVVGFTLGKLDKLLTEEAKLQKGVPTEVRRIIGELESMKGLLIDAESRAESETGVKTWVAQVREAAYDIQDVLDEYALLQHIREAKGFARKSKNLKKYFTMRHQIGKKIEELRTRIIDISSRKENFGFQKIQQGAFDHLSDQARHLRSAARYANEIDLVGIDNPKQELIGLSLGGESKLTVISILGMGGLGKTTLVGNVYDNKQVKAHFKAFAWVTVSQTFIIKEIFRSLVKEICGPGIEGLDKMEKDELIQKLRSHLQQKRYLIVLDDLWKVNDWETIKVGLPYGECGSTIIVTTRTNEVAADCADHVYNLQPLPLQQSRDLFYKNAFRGNLKGNCPPDLKSISEKFVQKCGGLPLAIRAIGRLLSTKEKTQVVWQNLYDRLRHLIKSNGHLQNMNQILLLSYHDLPHYLKPCFMCVSIFPEDHLIRRERLNQLWIAEGFVEIKEGMTVEEVADGYLHELIDRSLIQMASFTNYVTLEACRVHDVVREVILLKAREENFVTFPNGTALSDKTRRLVLHDIDNIAPKDKFLHLRTIFMFEKISIRSYFMRGSFSGIPLLKVLDLEGTNIKEFPSKVVNLFHLRFLSLRKTLIETLPESIGKLENLETLDLVDTEIQKLPISIVKLKYLRHLIAWPRQPFHFESRGWRNHMKGLKMTDGVGRLRSLQQLGYIEKTGQDKGVMIGELGKLTQLKWLGISGLTIEDGPGLCASIKKMKCLSSLSACAKDNVYTTLDLKHLSSPPPLLAHMDLTGRLEELPQWFSFLSNLVHLTLEHSALKEDPFTVLQHLQNLTELRLIRVTDLVEEFCCERKGFQKLKSLVLNFLGKLKMVKVEKGAMPNLQELQIIRCYALENVPFGIEHLTHLKELSFDFVGKELKKSIKPDGGKDLWKISHIPLVKIR